MIHMIPFSFVFGTSCGDVYSVSDVEGDILLALSNQISRMEATGRLKRKIFLPSFAGLRIFARHSRHLKRAKWESAPFFHQLSTNKTHQPLFKQSQVHPTFSDLYLTLHFRVIFDSLFLYTFAPTSQKKIVIPAQCRPKENPYP